MQEQKNKRGFAVRPAYLAFALFIAGAVVLAIEIAGARVIGASFGASLYVWSSLITVTLLSLAAGYWWGGTLADARPDPDRAYDVILQAGILLALVPLVKSAVLHAAGALGLRAGSFAAAAALFGGPLTLLGMVTPCAVKAAVRSESALAGVAGRLFAISTVGSFLGAIATGFFLVPLLSVDRTLFLISAALAALTAVPAIGRDRKRAALAFAVLLACLAMLFRPVPLPEARGMRVVFRGEGLYGGVRVVDSARGRSLLLNGILQGTMLPDGRPVERYFTFVDDLFRMCRPDARDLLAIGLGMGAFPRIAAGRGVRVDAVELDPLVLRIAEQYFAYRPAQGAAVIADGRYYLEQTSAMYDGVFLDAYASETLPLPLFSLEAFRAMARRLRPDGVVVMNFHDFREKGRDRAGASVMRTLAAVFPEVRAYEVQSWHDPAIRNVVFLASAAPLSGRCSAGALPPQLAPGISGGVLLTDAYNPLDVLYNPLSETMRNATLAAFPAAILLD